MERSINRDRFPFLLEVTLRDPDKAEWSTAIGQLEDPTEIRQWYKEYAAWLDEHHPGEGESIARSNVGYAVVYFGQKTAELWEEALGGLTHPVLGGSPSKTFGRLKQAHAAGRGHGQKAR